MPKGKARLATITDIEPENEETQREEEELEGFLSGLGPDGISEVSLYRILPTGKQKFITSGPTSQFSESYVQLNFGEGDYRVRAKVNGRWFRSKAFSCEGPPGQAAAAPNGHALPELERLKLEIEKAQLRLQEADAKHDADRTERERRQHEMNLALINGRATDGHGTSLLDLVTAVKSLKDLGAGEDTLNTIDKTLAIVEKINGLRGGGGKEEEGGILSWLKPVAIDAGRAAIPFILPWIQKAAGAPPPAPQPPQPGKPAIAEPLPPGPPTNEPPKDDKPPVAAGPESQPEITAQNLAELKRQALDFIVPIAQAGRNPEVYVDLAIEQVEVSRNPVIAQFVAEIVQAQSFDPWFADLQKIEPTIVTQRAWFQSFFDIMRDTLAALEQTESERSTDHE